MTSHPKLWAPEYLVSLDGQDIRMPVSGITSAECPVSLHLSRPYLDILVQEVLAAERSQKSGAVMFGTDSSKWPARWFDLMNLALQERRRYDQAVEDVVKRSAPSGH